MPYAAPKPCPKHPKVLLQRGDKCPLCVETKKQAQKQYDKKRGSSASRGYGYKWQQYREGFLAQHPLCERCQAKDKITAATEVDHIIPVSGPYDPLFWDTDNHQALCKSCHSSKTAREDGGYGNARIDKG